MTRCCVCDATYKNNSYLTFHTFPASLETHKSWLKACCIDSTEFKGSMKVCSYHFLVSDYDPTAWPTRRLLKTAVPSPSDQYPKMQMRMQKRKALLQDITLPTLEKKRRTNILKPISPRDLLEARPSAQVSDEMALENMEQAMEIHRSTILQGITSIDLLEAGPSKHCLDIGAAQNIQQDLVPTTILPKTPEKQILLDARYVGDLKPEHFITPKKAGRHLQLVKNTVEEQRKKIDNLQRQTRRLEDRMNSVKDLLLHLQDQQLLSSETANTILVEIL